MKGFHTYQTTLSHHDYEEMEVCIDNYGGDIGTVISIAVEDSFKSRITLNMGELKKLVNIADNFKKSHKLMRGNNDD